MKKIVLFPIALFSLLAWLGNLDGALPENTNAPNELTCGRQPCHNVPINVGNAEVKIEFANGDSVFFADSTYLLRVKIENPMTARNGFQILSLTAGNQNAGTWQLIEPNKMKIIPGIGLPNRKYVTHKAPGNQQNEWMVNWKAPATGTGKVVFYASVLSANDNGANTGDEVYSTNLEVEEGMPSSVPGAKPASLFKIYPSPAKSGVWVEFLAEMPADSFVFSLFDAAGVLLKSEKTDFRQRHFLDTEGLAAGIYFLKIETPGGKVTQRILIE